MTAGRPELPAAALEAFLRRHRLPDGFRQTASNHYLRLARRLPAWRKRGRPLLLGINGAQGTGKSTLADFLVVASRALHGWTATALSIDDFYLTRTERQVLSENVHPLLRTRGVPGTHDVGLIDATLERLHSLGAGDSLSLPAFSKADDERADESRWPVVTGPVDMVILEGWCVGSVPADDDEPKEPLNALERDEDPDGRWRLWVEERLREDYQPLFARFDALVLLAAPSFDAVYRWRLEQERKLAAVSAGEGIMSAEELARFIQHYERITRRNLTTLPGRASAVLRLDAAHAVVETRFQTDAADA